MSTNAELLHVIEGWRNRCQTFEKMHSMSRVYYRNLNHSIMITSLMMSSLSSIASLTVVIGNKSCESNTINIPLVVFNSIGIVASLLLTIHRFLRLSELQKEHDFYSDMFCILGNEITLQIALDQSDAKMFVSLSEYAKYCKQKLDILIDKDPAIPGFIEKKHMNM